MKKILICLLIAGLLLIGTCAMTAEELEDINETDFSEPTGGGDSDPCGGGQGGDGGGPGGVPG